MIASADFGWVRMDMDKGLARRRNVEEGVSLGCRLGSSADEEDEISLLNACFQL
jgi:hypothetical protein